MTETAPPIGEISKLEALRQQLKSDIPLNDLESLNDSIVIAKNVVTIVDQIKHLRTAIETTIDSTKGKSLIKNTDDSYEGLCLEFLFYTCDIYFV